MGSGCWGSEREKGFFPDTNRKGLTANHLILISLDINFNKNREPGIQVACKSNIPLDTGNPAFMQQQMDTLMDFPSVCYKDPVCGGVPPPSHATLPFILHNKQNQATSQAVRRRYLHHNTHQRATQAGMGRLSRFPYKAQGSRGGLLMITNSSNTASSALLSVQWCQEKFYVVRCRHTCTHGFCSFRIKNLKLLLLLKELTFVCFLLSGISDWSFHLRLASMEASWRKGSMRWLRHNRIYWLQVNWLESVIVGHICREDESYLNLQEASLYFSKPS